MDAPAVHTQSGIASQRKGRAMNQRSLLGRIGVAGVVIALVAGCSPSPDTSSQPTGTIISTPAPSAAPVPTSATAASVSPSEAPQPAWPYTSSWEIRDALFAEDGRVVLIEYHWEAGEGRITVLDRDGRIVPGWPWSLEPTGDGVPHVAFGPEGSLYVAARSGFTDLWSLHRLGPMARSWRASRSISRRCRGAASR